MELAINLFATVFTALFGLWAFVKPQNTAKLLGLQPKGQRGLSEIRATYGGLNIGLGAFATWCQSAEVFQMLAVAYLGAAIGRTISLAMDKTFPKLGIRFIMVEIIVGVCLLV